MHNGAFAAYPGMFLETGAEACDFACLLPSVCGPNLITGPVSTQVWRVLTDYERLAEFVPNLERCVRLPRGPNGRVRLRQARLEEDLLLCYYGV